MSDRRLQVFNTVAKELSFTKAAEILHMTQPAVTFQIRQLEEYFNTRLFDRTHNRITLTAAGLKVQEYAIQIFNLYAELENSVRLLTGEVSGSLTIGASTTIAEYMLPVLLGDFKSKYPDIEIHLKVSNSEGVINMIENNAIDLGVVETIINNKNLVVEECRNDELLAIVSPKHPLSKKKKVKVERLLEYPFICREKGSGTREVISRYLHQHNCTENEMTISMELGSPEAIKGAVEAGMGVSIVSRTTVQKELKLGTLCSLTLDPPLARSFSFIHQKQKFRVRIMDELLTFARQYCQV